MSKKLSFFEKLISISVVYRRLILVSIDLLILFFSTYISLASDFYQTNNDYNFYLIIFVPFLGIFYYLLTGQYVGITRFVGSKEIYKLMLRNTFFSFIVFIIFRKININEVNFRSIIIFWVLTNGFSGFSRLIARDLIRIFSRNGNYKQNKAIIYGAGVAGVQLYNALKISKKLKIKYFIDDNKELWNREIDGVKIISINNLENVIKFELIDEILFAIPSLRPSQKSKILNNLKKFKIPISQIPSVDEINRGYEKISTLKSINIEDLLGRDAVQTDLIPLNEEFNQKSICVMGAGGSIGLEICKQLTKYKIKNLILLEHSEVALYEINQYFGKLKSDKVVKIIPILGSCLDKSLIERVFFEYEVDLVFHAAAYKHVPLVQLNPIQGVKNNILSTYIICQAAINNRVKKVLLISTDKAVRPTNIMGASKRISEMIFQAYNDDAQKKNKNIIFSMVRFGNVLNSSGSVIPLFEKQINEGGPITVTHPDITRYFMTIREAVELVLQSTFMAAGGEVFLLDMGSPVNIVNLAKQMINLNNLKLKSEQNLKGDISIVFSGLRPGEKLYEELLVDASAIATKHPRIFKAKEKFVTLEKILPKINQLEKAIESQDIEEINKIILFLVPEIKFSKNK